MEYTCKGMCSTHTSSLNLMIQCKIFLKIVGQMLQPLVHILAMLFTKKDRHKDILLVLYVHIYIELKITIEFFYLGVRGRRR